MKSDADFIDLQQAGVTAPGRHTALRTLVGIDLKVARGEFVSLIGYLGCGKSILLHLIAGLLPPAQGLVLCDGREVGAPAPERALVAPDHALLPWMTCYENVMLAVERVFGARESRAALRERVLLALELVGMIHAAHLRPHEISAGMGQRVCLARALSAEPKVLLLDEPFAVLDALTRAQLQDELLRIVERLRCTVVMATHDVDEAVLLSDRIVMLTSGPASTIGGVVPVLLGRPRDRLALVDDLGAVACRQRVLEFLSGPVGVRLACG